MAHSEIHVRDSLEWQATDCELIVRGKVTDVRKSPPVHEESGGIVVFEEVTLQSAETLRGELQDTLVRFRWKSYNDPRYSAAQWKASGHEMLFFLKRATMDEEKPQLRGQLILRDSIGAVDLTDGRADFYPTVSMRQEVLTSQSEILSRVREQVSLIHAGTVSGKSLEINVPFDTDAYEALWGGSAVILVVPYEYAKDFEPEGTFGWRKVPDRPIDPKRVIEEARSHVQLTRASGLIDFYFYSDREKRKVQQESDCQFPKGTTVISGYYKLIAMDGGTLLSVAESHLKFKEGAAPKIERMGENTWDETILWLLPPAECDGVQEFVFFSVDQSNQVKALGATWASPGLWSFDGETMKACVLNKERQQKFCRAGKLGSAFIQTPWVETWE